MTSPASRTLTFSATATAVMGLALSLAGPAHAAPPDSGPIYATPANIAFQYINLDETYVSDAAGQYTSDAWDDTGIITLYPQDPMTSVAGAVPLTFTAGDCTVTGTWDDAEAEFVGNTTATCTRVVNVGSASFAVTLARMFEGSWARWALSAERDFGAGDLFGRFDGDLGSDDLTCYYSEDDDRSNFVNAEAVAGPGDIPCPTVTPVADPTRPVLYTNVVKPVSSRSFLGNGSESQWFEFPLLADGGTGSFVYATAVVDYVTGSSSSFQCALDTASGLTGADFGTVLDACLPRPSSDPSQIPPSWFQAYGRTADETCLDGWKPSWAQWPNSGSGGYVCEREEYWNTSTNGWAYRLGAKG